MERQKSLQPRIRQQKYQSDYYLQNFSFAQSVSSPIKEIHHQNMFKNQNSDHVLPYETIIGDSFISKRMLDYQSQIKIQRQRKYTIQSKIMSHQPYKINQFQKFKSLFEGVQTLSIILQTQKEYFMEMEKCRIDFLKSINFNKEKRYYEAHELYKMIISKKVKLELSKEELKKQLQDKENESDQQNSQNRQNCSSQQLDRQFNVFYSIVHNCYGNNLRSLLPYSVELESRQKKISKQLKPNSFRTMSWFENVEEIGHSNNINFQQHTMICSIQDVLVNMQKQIKESHIGKEHLDFGNFGINNEELSYKIIPTLLKDERISNIYILNLSSNFITAQGCEILSKLLNKFNKIHILDLSGNILEAKAIKILAESSSATINIANFSANNLYLDSIPYLNLFIHKNKLSFIHLYSNYLGIKPQTYQIQRTTLRGAGRQQQNIDVIQSTPEGATYQDNQFSPKALALMIKNAKGKVCIGDNQAELTQILRSLRESPILQFQAYRNTFDPANFQLLEDVLRQHKYLRLVNLAYCNLNQNSFNAAIYGMIANSQNGNVLKELNLQKNRLDHKIVRYGAIRFLAGVKGGILNLSKTDLQMQDINHLFEHIKNTQATMLIINDILEINEEKLVLIAESILQIFKERRLNKQNRFTIRCNKFEQTYRNRIAFYPDFEKEQI